MWLDVVRSGKCSGTSRKINPGLKKSLTVFLPYPFFPSNISRNLFAPGYTETHYNQTGQAQTVPLSHTVSADPSVQGAAGEHHPPEPFFQARLPTAGS